MKKIQLSLRGHEEQEQTSAIHATLSSSTSNSRVQTPHPCYNRASFLGHSLDKHGRDQSSRNTTSEQGHCRCRGIYMQEPGKPKETDPLSYLAMKKFVWRGQTKVVVGWVERFLRCYRIWIKPFYGDGTVSLQNLNIHMEIKLGSFLNSNTYHYANTNLETKRAFEILKSAL